MSELGWRVFLGVEGFDDWVVLHGGATAVFRVASLGEAARVTVAVARERARGDAVSGRPRRGRSHR